MALLYQSQHSYFIRQRVYLSNTATSFDLKLGHQDRNNDSSVVIDIDFRHSRH